MGAMESSISKFTYVWETKPKRITNYYTNQSKLITTFPKNLPKNTHKKGQIIKKY